MNTKFIILLGKSCVGKDSFLKELKNKYNNKILHEMKNSTTRPKRYQEENTYYFVSDKDFLNYILQDQLIECKEYNGWFYGLKKDEIQKNKINLTSLSIERTNLFYDFLKETNQLQNCLVICMYAKEEERLQRYIKRLEKYKKINLKNLQEMIRRFMSENKDYNLNTLEYFPNILYFCTEEEKITKEKEKILKAIENFIKN